MNGAEERDRLADERDRLADERDRAAEARPEQGAGEHARRDREASREDRAQAAKDRARSARAAQAAADEAAHLRLGMESRTLIGQAQGLLMAKHGIGPDEAFQLLVTQSQARNVKLHDIARDVVDGATPS